MKSTILVVEKDGILRRNLKGDLFSQGFEIIEALDKTEVIQSLQSRKPDLVIIGSSLDNNITWDGLRLAEHIRKGDKNIPLIMITRSSSEAQVIAALRAGVNDYFKHPFTSEELIGSVKRNLLEFFQKSLSHNTMSFSDLIRSKIMIGTSYSMKEVKAYILKAAASDSTVLITGETGTGKELAAELIHKNSPNRRHPLVHINCAAIPDSLLESELFGHERGAFTGAFVSKKGKFELAEGGTVFLDEIGDMNLNAQAKILRAIERKEVYRLGGKGGIPLTVRVMAATNQDLEQLMVDGKFRKDLYYRINVFRIHLPPLRDRKEDILILIDHYIRELNHRFSRQVKCFTDEALDLLLNYDWPGNVRELKNLIEAAFINLPSRHVVFIDLPKQFEKRFKKLNKLHKNEKERLLSALFATNWNKSKTAKQLNWSRMTIYRKMAKYHIVARRSEYSKTK